MTKLFLVQVCKHFVFVPCIAYSLCIHPSDVFSLTVMYVAGCIYIQTHVYLHAGNSFQLVEATGVIIVGHFSIDGELKKEHYSVKHHNMLVVQGRSKLIEETIELLSFPGQNILHLVTKLDDGQGLHYCI